MRHHLMALVLSLCLCCIGCSSSTTLHKTTLSPTAKAYLDAAFAFIKQHYVNTAQVNWTEQYQSLLVLAAQAQTPDETYTALNVFLRQLDKHSSFLTPDEVQTITDNPLTQPIPDGHAIGSDIGYIHIPAVVAVGSQAQIFAAQAQAILASLDAPARCGWIVDLRGNSGGSIWPMLAGIGPVLGDGIAGSFKSATTATSWGYRQGGAFLGSTVMVQVDHPHALLESMPPVAVLTDGRTASSGEAVLVAFRGRPATRSFGTATAGYATANSLHLLSDGAAIVLTDADDVDRTGTVYTEVPIQPDVVVAGNSISQPMDATLQAAIAWLQQQEHC